MALRWWISVLLVLCNQNNQIEEGMKGANGLSSNMTKPSGTVTTIETEDGLLLHGGKYMKPIPRSSFNTTLANDGGNHKYAVISHRHPEADIHGITATFNVWRPFVESGDLTIAQLWIVNNLEGPRETIEAGWMIDPKNQPAANPFLFIYYTPDGYNTRCYNLECEFDWKDKGIRPGAHSIRPWTAEHGQQIEISIRIMQDIGTGDWSFIYQDQLIGIWPGRLFQKLRRGANLVQWGGEVIAGPNSNRPTTTGMGSGRFAQDGRGRAAYISDVFYYDANHVKTLPDPVHPRVDNPNCYSMSRLTPDAYFYFGGPGGREQACIDSEVQPPPPF